MDLDDDKGLAGRVISGYRIIGGIGEGGMGTVYLAFDNISEGQLDAVKVLNRDLVVDRERMRREAVTANRVDHPNVCKVFNYIETHDVETGQNLTLIAMELVRGPTLREVQEGSGGTLGLHRAARVVREVASALQAVHAGGIVHRDIKPTNIIVTHDSDGAEKVKLVDFGIAKKEEGGAGQDLTEAGYVAATVHYASPEQLKGKAELRSDIYSLGVVFYELLAGSRPFEASGQAELYSLILDPRADIPRLDEVRPDLGLPKTVQAVIDRAMARDLDDRFQDASEFAVAVDRLTPDMAKTVVSPVPDFAGSTPEPTLSSLKVSVETELPREKKPKRPWAKPPSGRPPGPLLKKLGFGAGVLVLASVLVIGFGGLGEGGWLGGSGQGGGEVQGSEGERGAMGSAGSEEQIDPSGSGGGTDPNQGEAAIGASADSVADTETSLVETRTGSDPDTEVVIPPPDSAVVPLCEAPIEGFLVGLQSGVDEIEDPFELEARRRSALACWNKEEELTREERGLAAYTIGYLLKEQEGCGPARVWLDRAVEIGSEESVNMVAYQSLQRICSRGPR